MWIFDWCDSSIVRGQGLPPMARRPPPPCPLLGGPPGPRTILRREYHNSLAGRVGRGVADRVFLYGEW